METQIFNNQISVSIRTQRVPGIQVGTTLETASLTMVGVKAAIAVLNGEYPVGILTLDRLQELLNRSSNVDELRQISVEEIMALDFEAIYQTDTLENAQKLLLGNALPVVVVVDALGQYVGLITASDIVCNEQVQIRPPAVGGMATPLGVYLTTGTISAGASMTGIFLTGLLLAMLFFVSDNLVYLFAWYTERFTPFDLYTWNKLSFSLSQDFRGVLGGIVSILALPIFLLLVRLIPLSGTHGAEHKVVNAIERGEQLTLDVVRRMPRVHPRCGTNIAVGAGLFLSFVQAQKQLGLGEMGMLMALVITLALWKPLGNILQHYVTTKEPTDKQLEGAIKAGKDLLEKYQYSYHGPISLPQRIIGSGLPYVIAGTALGGGIIYLISLLTNIDFPLIR